MKKYISFDRTDNFVEVTKQEMKQILTSPKKKYDAKKEAKKARKYLKNQGINV